jgi:hypothetical protein
VFLATAPHLGSARGGLTGPALRLACAQPGDQISIFGDALRELSERAAYLYREGDRYWFSTQPTLNRIADERAKDVSSDDADAEIAAILRKDQGSRGGFHRVHGAPDNPIDVEDARSIALVILSPATATRRVLKIPAPLKLLSRTRCNGVGPDSGASGMLWSLSPPMKAVWIPAARSLANSSPGAP